MNPEFHHIEANQIPAWQDNGVEYKLIAGEAFGKKSPVPVYSKLYMIEVKAEKDALIDIKGELYGESGLYILEGEIESNGFTYGPKQILITLDAHLCTFEMKAGTTVYIFGGEPFAEERFISWNFVSSSKDTLDQAKQKWINHEFPKVPGDDGYVPLPSPSR